MSSVRGIDESQYVETVYRVWDSHKKTYITCGSSRRTIWTRITDCQRHVRESNEQTWSINAKTPRFFLHTFKLVKID